MKVKQLQEDELIKAYYAKGTTKRENKRIAKRLYTNFAITCVSGISTR